MIWVDDSCRAAREWSILLSMTLKSAFELRGLVTGLAFDPEASACRIMTLRPREVIPSVSGVEESDRNHDAALSSRDASRSSSNLARRLLTLVANVARPSLLGCGLGSLGRGINGGEGSCSPRTGMIMVWDDDGPGDARRSTVLGPGDAADPLDSLSLSLILSYALSTAVIDPEADPTPPSWSRASSIVRSRDTVSALARSKWPMESLRRVVRLWS